MINEVEIMRDIKFRAWDNTEIICILKMKDIIFYQDVQRM